MKAERVDNGISVLQYAINNQISIAKACEIFDRNPSYCADIEYLMMKKIKEGNESVLPENSSTFRSLYNEYRGRERRVTSQVLNGPIEEQIIEDEIIEKKQELIRDNEGKIEKYFYSVKQKGGRVLEGYLSREEMETIYSTYPYLTTDKVAIMFSRFSNSEFQKVLRALDITKTTLFPPHINEELSEDEISDWVLQAKAQRTYHSIDTKSENFYELELKKVYSELSKLRSQRYYIENLIDNAVTCRQFVPAPSKTSTTVSDSLYVFFGDLHAGKKTDAAKFNRGYNKDILQERIIEIAEAIKAEEFDNLNLFCLGDLVETILENGMHSGQVLECDLIGEEQISFVYEALTFMIDSIFDKHPSVKINFYGIGGNHDRNDKDRNVDRKRTASRIIYGVLNRIYRNDERVTIQYPDDGIIELNEEGLTIIGHHGDSPLAKRTHSDMINLFGNNKHYNVIIKGHLHKYQVEEFTNGCMMTTPAVCSTDWYAGKYLGFESTPGFIIGRKPSNVQGFNFDKRTLY